MLHEKKIEVVCSYFLLSQHLGLRTILYYVQGGAICFNV